MVPLLLACGPRGKREPLSHWFPQEVTVPPLEDMLFCAYKETRVPTYHLNSPSPANILRMEKASICDVTSTPSPHSSSSRKESFSSCKTWGWGWRRKGKLLLVSALRLGHRGQKAGLRTTCAWGRQIEDLVEGTLLLRGVVSP